MSELLPLFPLEVVLFPEAPLPLHIFEPRYREMIGECVTGKLPFGVVRAKEEALAEIGCTAEIIAITKKHDDGRMDILTLGRRRFEVGELNQERSFLRAQVTYLEDKAGPAPRAQAEQAVVLFKELLGLANADLEPPEPDAPNLSFQLVAPFPLDLDFKQTLLGMRSEAERLAAIVEYYEVLLPQMRRKVKAQRTSRGNGHVA
ncbi:MAG: LON peptidase substrate-binding domain-containing protein [Terriglobales bacterium]